MRNLELGPVSHRNDISASVDDLEALVKHVVAIGGIGDAEVVVALDRSLEVESNLDFVLIDEGDVLTVRKDVGSNLMLEDPRTPWNEPGSRNDNDHRCVLHPNIGIPLVDLGPSPRTRTDRDHT